MQQYIRHPSDIPINFMMHDDEAAEEMNVNNIGAGDLCFSSATELRAGACLTVEIPVSNPVFVAKGVVAWCHMIGNCYEVGVQFVDSAIESSMRMVEQVCHIEHYKKEVAEREGRNLSGKEAALEWIHKFAKDFPR